MLLYGWKLIMASNHPATFGGYSHSDSEVINNNFSLSHDLVKPRDQRVM